MAKHELWELKQMQSLPLEAKIRMTRYRIRQWVDEFGEDGVYVSFSGGKDSTVLLDIVRKDYPNIEAVFVNTGLEYPSVSRFATSKDNVTVLRPTITFKETITKYGYPIIGKEVAEKVYYAQKYLKWYLHEKAKKMPSAYGLSDTLGILNRNDERYKIIGNGDLLQELFGTKSNAPFKAKALFGNVIHKEKGIETTETSKRFDFSRYKWLINAPFLISSRCCEVMKKKPIKKYAHNNRKNPITAQMAGESKLRLQHWLESGCNSFGSKNPKSNPMSFWIENDVLQYIHENNLQIAEAYGDVVVKGTENGQTCIAELLDDYRDCQYVTTGCKRTGCIFCMFGITQDKDRFIRLAQQEPKLCDYVMRGGKFFYRIFDREGTEIKLKRCKHNQIEKWCTNNANNQNFKIESMWQPSKSGLGYWFVIEWLNVHGNLKIGMPDREKYLEEYQTEETRKYLVKGAT